MNSPDPSNAPQTPTPTEVVAFSHGVVGGKSPAGVERIPLDRQADEGPAEQAEPQSLQVMGFVNGEPVEVPSGSRWPTERDCVRGDRYTEVVQGLHGDLAWMRRFTGRACTVSLLIGAMLGSFITWSFMR